jgi:hypothetical protein
MKNNQQCFVIMSLRHVDHAVKISKVLKEWARLVGCGGDALLNNIFVGHDVNVLDVKAILENGNVLDK